MAKSLTPLPKIQYLSAAVTSILGCNPSNFCLLGTNSYLVGKGKERILIDTSNPNVPEYISNLKSTLEATKSTIRFMLITHHHSDHIGGVTDVRDMIQANIPVYKVRHSTIEDLKLDNLHYVDDKHKFEVEGASVQVVCNPGHTADHFAVWLKEENAIFSGDSVLGEGTTTFTNLSDYMRSLHTLKAMKPSILYPGHGPVIADPDSTLSHYIEHRMEREGQILQVLSGGKTLRARAIVEILYKEYPSEVYGAATHMVGLHLEKLLDDDKVTKVQSNGGSMWSIV